MKQTNATCFADTHIHCKASPPVGGALAPKQGVHPAGNKRKKSTKRNVTTFTKTHTCGEGSFPNRKTSMPLAGMEKETNLPQSSEEKKKQKSSERVIFNCVRPRRRALLTQLSLEAGSILVLCVFVWWGWECIGRIVWRFVARALQFYCHSPPRVAVPMEGSVKKGEAYAFFFYRNEFHLAKSPANVLMVFLG